MADPELKDGENHNYKKATTRFNIIFVRMEASQAQLLSCCDQRSGGKDERDAVSPSWPNALSAVSVPINPWPRIPLSRGRYTGKPSVEPFDERRSVGKKARCSWHQHLLLGSHAQGWWVGLFTCPARQGILRPMISWYQSRRSRFLMATYYFSLKDLHM